MQMFIKKKMPEDDVSRFLMAQGVYSVSKPVRDTEREKLHFEIPTTGGSFWKGMRYSFMLALALWWFPTFGLMIAGYAGGKKTGRPWLGVLSAAIPIGLIFTGIWYLQIHQTEISATISAYMSTFISAPVIGPYASFIYQYTATLQNMLIASGNFQMDTFLLCMAMAYIGGSGKSISISAAEQEGSVSGIQGVPAAAPGVQIIMPASQNMPAHKEEREEETLENMEKISPADERL